MNLSEKQKEVFRKAKEALQNQSWFKGICMDNFPTDQEIDKEGIEDSVSSVCMETEMWDAWDENGFIPLRIARFVTKREMENETSCQ